MHVLHNRNMKMKNDKMISGGFERVKLICFLVIPTFCHTSLSHENSFSILNSLNFLLNFI